MYKEWLDEDQEDIEMSEDEIKELQSQLLEVKDKLGAKSSVLSSQEETLNDKDSRLTVRLCLLIDAYAYLHCLGIPIQDPAEAVHARPDGRNPHDAQPRDPPGHLPRRGIHLGRRF